MLESVRLSSVGVRTMEAAIRSCAARISSILTGSADASAGIVFCWFICVTLYDRKRDISTAIRSGVGRKQALCRPDGKNRSEEHTSELQSLMRISYAVFCLKKKKIHK